MHVDDPALPPVEPGPREDREEAGEQDELGSALPERRVEAGGPCVVDGPLDADHPLRDTVASSALEHAGTGSVRHDQDDRRRELSALDRSREPLEGRPLSGGEQGEADRAAHRQTDSGPPNRADGKTCASAPEP